MHYQANGDYDTNEVRRLHRIMIKNTPIAGESVTEAERRAAPAQRVPAGLSA